MLKTKAHGITGNLLGWIKDFLSNRTQRVVVNGVQSEQAQVTSGIPQGSVLGPLLLVIHIDDLPHVTKCPTRLIADDTKVFAQSDLVNNTETLLEDLDSLQAWSETWLLKFHPRNVMYSSLVILNQTVPITCQEKIKMVTSVLYHCLRANSRRILVST